MSIAQMKSAELLSRLDRLNFSKWHRNFFIVAFLGVLFDAADFALFGAALPPISREFGLGPAQAGFLATVGLIGAFVGALFWGTISDYIGRRVAFQATVGIFAVFTGLIAMSWSVVSLSAFRFMSNFGLGGEVPVTSTLGSEFSPGRLRGSMTGGIMSAFPVGLAVAALMSLLIIPNFGWRTLFAVGVIPALLAAVRPPIHAGIGALFCSARGAFPKPRPPWPRSNIRPWAAISRPKEIAAIPKLPLEELVETKVTVAELLSPPRFRRTILLWIVSFGFLWSSNGILFMLPTILQQRGIPLTQAITFMLIQAISAFFGYAACGFLVDRYGRRIVLFLYFFIGAFFHLWFAEASGIWLYFAAAAIGWVNPGVYGATSVYVGELHPTRLRATAVGWFFGIGRIGSFLAPTVVGLMLANGLGHYVLHTFALSFLIAAIALWLVGVETKGRALEEINQAQPA